jgi:hypothetical protein
MTRALILHLIHPLFRLLLLLKMTMIPAIQQPQSIRLLLKQVRFQTMPYLSMLMIRTDILTTMIIDHGSNSTTAANRPGKSTRVDPPNNIISEKYYTKYQDQ